MRTLVLIAALAIATPAMGAGGLVCHVDVVDNTTLRPSLNMRILPDPKSSIIGDLENDSHVLIVETKGRWAFVVSPTLGRGWMAWISASGNRYLNRCFHWDGKGEME